MLNFHFPTTQKNYLTDSCTVSTAFVAYLFLDPDPSGSYRLMFSVILSRTSPLLDTNTTRMQMQRIRKTTSITGT